MTTGIAGSPRNQDPHATAPPANRISPQYGPIDQGTFNVRGARSSVGSLGSAPDRCMRRIIHTERRRWPHVGEGIAWQSAIRMDAAKCLASSSSPQNAASLADTMGRGLGHGMARDGSLQRTPLSQSGR